MVEIGQIVFEKPRAQYLEMKVKRNSTNTVRPSVENVSPQ